MKPPSPRSKPSTLGDAVVELTTATLRAKLAGAQRAAGLLHRQVTVLFADMVGSTTLAHGLDAEDTLAEQGAPLEAHGRHCRWRSAWARFLAP